MLLSLFACAVVGALLSGLAGLFAPVPTLTPEPTYTATEDAEWTDLQTWSVGPDVATDAHRETVRAMFVAADLRQWAAKLGTTDRDRFDAFLRSAPAPMPVFAGPFASTVSR